MGFLKRVVQAVGAKPSVAAAAKFPRWPFLAVMRKMTGVQLSARELSRVTAAIRAHPECRLLVFGVGNDSAYWHAVNRGGRTVFLEDDAGWLRKVVDRFPKLTAFPLQYSTQMAGWEKALDQPDPPPPAWPAGVVEGEWDVVLVDGPAAFPDTAPGRRQSVAAAPKLVAPGGDIFVHDSERAAEQAYCARYLPAAGLVAEVDRLRHYRLPAG